MSAIRICSPFVPTLPPRVGSHEATSERPDNVRIVPLSPRLQAMMRAEGHLFAAAAVEKMRLWENGRRLRVAFLDGALDLRARVAAVAKEWEAVANLRLDFGESDAEIRVSFAQRGFSWSAIGTDALTVAAGAATVNLGWLEPTTSPRELQRVVRHEFGHALGMIHEHQNPAARIPWDRPKVYAHYAQQGWSQADVDANIFAVASEDSTNHTAYDPTSIMQYAIPDSLTVGSFAVSWNTVLSTTDVEFMGRQYPRGAPGAVELEVGAPPLAAELAGGEVDSYRFEVAGVATHAIATEGATDTVMTLHGPNDPGAILAWDDDRGRGANARIVRRLVAGTYWLSVRHKEPAKAGAYSIGVRRLG